jgi:hypothetical protein
VAEVRGHENQHVVRDRNQILGCGNSLTHRH